MALRVSSDAWSRRHRPEAPGGFRKVSYGPVVNGRLLRSPACGSSSTTWVKHQMSWAEGDRQEDAWVERQLATAPPLTVAQVLMLRRAKRDLAKGARLC